MLRLLAMLHHGAHGLHMILHQLELFCFELLALFRIFGVADFVGKFHHLQKEFLLFFERLFIHRPTAHHHALVGLRSSRHCVVFRFFGNDLNAWKRHKKSTHRKMS